MAYHSDGNGMRTEQCWSRRSSARVSLATERAGGHHGRDGFGLAEAIVALALLGVMLGGLLPAFALSIRANTTSELRTGAVAVAQQELDDLRVVTTWPADGHVKTVQTGAATYQVEFTIQEYCDAGSCFAGARSVAVEVSHNGNSLYRVETVFTSLDVPGS